MDIKETTVTTTTVIYEYNGKKYEKLGHAVEAKRRAELEPRERIMEGLQNLKQEFARWVNYNMEGSDATFYEMKSRCAKDQDARELYNRAVCMLDTIYEELK
jgi:hypothetical protein